MPPPPGPSLAPPLGFILVYRSPRADVRCYRVKHVFDVTSLIVPPAGLYSDRCRPTDQVVITVSNLPLPSGRTTKFTTESSLKPRVADSLNTDQRAPHLYENNLNNDIWKCERSDQFCSVTVVYCKARTLTAKAHPQCKYAEIKDEI